MKLAVTCDVAQQVARDSRPVIPGQKWLRRCQLGLMMRAQRQLLGISRRWPIGHNHSQHSVHLICRFVLWGTGETLSPEADQIAMFQVLRRGQEVKISGAGHLNIVEHPASTAPAIKDFIAPARRPG